MKDTILIYHSKLEMIIKKLIKNLKDNLLNIIILTFVLNTVCEILFDIQPPDVLVRIWSIALLWVGLSGWI